MKPLKYEISLTFEDKRKKITKKHFDELAQDHMYDIMTIQKKYIK